MPDPAVRGRKTAWRTVLGQNVASDEVVESKYVSKIDGSGKSADEGMQMN